MSEDKDLSFFGDINKKLLVIAAGLISFYALLPLLIDRITSIFSLSANTAYTIALLIYFLTPVILYLLYYLLVRPLAGASSIRIHPIAGLLALLLLGSVYLLCNWKPLIIVLSLAIFACCVAIYCLGMVKPKFLVKALDNNDYAHRPVHREFKLISSIVTLVFTLFYFLNQDKVWQALRQTDRTQKQEAIAEYKYGKKMVELPRFTQRWKSVFYNGAMQVLANQPDTTLTIHAVPAAIRQQFRDITGLFTQLGASETVMDIDSTLDAAEKMQQGLYQLVLNPATGDTSNMYRAYEMNFYLQEYSKAIVQKQRDQTAYAWRKIIVNLQFRGLLWLNLLIMAGLWYWLAIAVQGRVKRQEYENRLEEYRYKEREIDDKQAKLEMEGQARIASNIGQIITVIYLCLLLAIPFFKRIDTNDINPDRPFLQTIWPFSQLSVLNSYKTDIYNQAPVDIAVIMARLEKIDQNVADFRQLHIRDHTSTLEKMEQLNEKTNSIIRGQWYQK